VEIRPGEGVGPFRFGLTEDELIRQLGSPDKRYRTDSGVERLQYFGPRSSSPSSRRTATGSGGPRSTTRTPHCSAVASWANGPRMSSRA
jgi:hypothetical protein